MTWTLVWTAPSRQALNRIHWKDAAVVDAAVMRFARTGEGDAYRRPTDNATTLRLAIGQYRVQMALDRRAGVLRVLWLYRADW